MRNLDGVDAGIVERARDLRYLVNAILMSNGMHAVAQRHILDIEPIRFGIEHQAHRCASFRSAICSAVRKAAEVMMSRFPA